MKILMTACTGLGNFLLKTPMIKKMHELYPDAKIDLIGGCPDNAEFIFKDSKYINKVRKYNKNFSLKEKINFYSDLRKENYDVVFIPFDDETGSLWWGVRLIKPKQIVTHYLFNKITIKRLIRFGMISLGKNITIVPFLAGRHEIDLNLDLLQYYINKPIERDYSTFMDFSKNTDILTKFNLEKEQYFILQIGARSGLPTPKRWGIDNFKKLIEDLKIKYPEYKIVTIGNQKDYDQFIKVIDEKYDIINTAGKTSLQEAATLLHYCKVSVVHDSGGMHIGSAVDANMICLYGPTDYTRSRSLTKNAKMVYSKNDCFAVMYNAMFGEDEVVSRYGEKYCMSAITVDMVLDKVNEFLSEE